MGCSASAWTWIIFGSYTQGASAISYCGWYGAIFHAAVYNVLINADVVLSGLGKIGGDVGYCVGASGFPSFADAERPSLGDLIGCCWWDCWLDVNVVAELHFLFDVIIVGGD